MHTGMNIMATDFLQESKNGEKQMKSICLNNGNNKKNWNLEEIDFDAIDIASVSHDEFLFMTLASASFVEIYAEMYSENLIAHFCGDDAVTDWLEQCWQNEEVQHGRALRKYVETVWPGFDWMGACHAFISEYRALCTIDQLESSRALELIARCVVETGTASFYRSLQHYVQEPILRKMLGNIKSDEISHYRKFHHYFSTRNAIENQGVWPVVAAIWRRIQTIRGQDSYIAFKHVYIKWRSNQDFSDVQWNAYVRTLKRLARVHYPFSMAIKMLIKPIPIFGLVKRALLWPLLGIAVLMSCF